MGISRQSGERKALFAVTTSTHNRRSVVSSRQSIKGILENLEVQEHIKWNSKNVWSVRSCNYRLLPRWAPFPSRICHGSCEKGCCCGRSARKGLCCPCCREERNCNPSGSSHSS